VRVVNAYRDERGAVAVFVAILILPLVLLMAFAIDTGNWWTHKRHLQTQADSGAFAGGFGPWFGSDGNPADCDGGTPGSGPIESAAHSYGGESWNSQYGPSGTVRVLVNSTDYAENGGADFTDVGTPCQTMLQGTGADGKQIPGFLDLKITESGLLNFFGAIPGFSSVTAHAHARVEIQAVSQESGVRPLAVVDTGLYKRAYADLYPHGGGSLIKSVELGTRSIESDETVLFAGSGDVTFADTNVDVRIRLGNANCTLGGTADTDNCDTFGDSAGGMNFINVFDPAGSAPGDGDAPQEYSVSMPPGLSDCEAGYPRVLDPYFTYPNSCTAYVKAYVRFAPGAVTGGSGQNAFVTVNGIDAAAGNDADGDYWIAPISVPADSGIHEMTVEWRQTYGTIGSGKKAQDCSKKTCDGSFGVQQAAFSATEDEDSYDPISGKIELVQIGEGGGSGANSFAKGSSHTLQFTVQVRGLSNSKPDDPPTVLRAASPQSNGLIDCMDGNNGVPDASYAMTHGCDRPVYIWPEGTPCVDASNSPSPTPIDCVQPVPGHKSKDITDPIAALVHSNCNNWNAYRDSGTPIPPGDPRRITVIIVEPPLKKKGDMYIRNLASFYVTGVDGEPGSDNPTGCANDIAKKYQIKGHWMKFVPPGGGIGDGGCVPGNFGDCIAVLTQ
jgi:Putative Flp pilus-assembly TadE/G-like